MEEIKISRYCLLCVCLLLHLTNSVLQEYSAITVLVNYDSYYILSLAIDPKS